MLSEQKNINETTTVQIYSFLEYQKELSDKEDFLNKVCEDLTKLNQIDEFGGCYDKQAFIEQITKSLFLDTQADVNERLSEEEIFEYIEKTILLVREIIDGKNITIYVFPTNSEQTIKYVGGVYAELIWTDCIHLYIHPTQNWKNEMQSAILHEIAHNSQSYYSYDMTLFEHLVADGLAERFQESFLNKKNSFTAVISKDEASKILKEIEPKFNLSMNDDPNIHDNLFFGSEEYKPGTGYTIGYYITEKLMEEKTDWKTILTQKPNKDELKLF